MEKYLIGRRKALHLLAASTAAWMARYAVSQAAGGPRIAGDIFTNTRDSLRTYVIPEWFADAKFGIWAHWGPQSAVGNGDWYARNMYVEGSGQYEYHLKRFGPQSKAGYKDVIPLYTADKWDPDHLVDLYQRAGAKYFVSMGVHHDNYDLWNSKHQPRWNSVVSGPHKDVVKLWAAAARKRGMRFGVSEHLSNSFDWLAPAHLADKKGPFAGIPYDGQNPAFADLYHNYQGQPAGFAQRDDAMGRVAPERWKQEYFNRIKDLVDQHQPDLLYTDGGIPFDAFGLGLVAETYNVGAHDFRGHSEGVYNSKAEADCAAGTCVLDRERGVLPNIWPAPWQTDTCIGNWHYQQGLTYKTPKKVIDLLVDIISKNGNLLLNFPLPASGELDAAEMRVLEGITEWMSVNGEGVFATRPWKVSGEGPSMHVVVAQNGFNEGKQPDLGAKDIRFTRKGQYLYAFVQGWPEAQGRPSEVMIEALGLNSPQQPGKILEVRLLGQDGALKFLQSTSGLTVTLPSERPAASQIGITLRANFA